MLFISYFFRFYFNFFCRNFLISKYFIYNIFLLPKISGFFLLFDFFNGLALWKRRFSTIYILFLFIFYFLFEYISWLKLYNFIKKNRIINVLFTKIFTYISRSFHSFHFFSKLIISSFFCKSIVFYRSKMYPNIFRISLNFFFELIICEYFLYFNFFFRRIFDSFAFFVFIIFDNRGTQLSYDILRLFSFKL